MGSDHLARARVHKTSMAWWLPAGVALLLCAGYGIGYAAARASHRVVHVHWGGLGRWGCSRLVPSDRGSARAWAPAIAAETSIRALLDHRWGQCPDAME